MQRDSRWQMGTGSEGCICDLRAAICPSFKGSVVERVQQEKDKDETIAAIVKLGVNRYTARYPKGQGDGGDAGSKIR